MFPRSPKSIGKKSLQLTLISSSWREICIPRRHRRLGHHKHTPPRPLSGLSRTVTHRDKGHCLSTCPGTAGDAVPAAPGQLGALVRGHAALYGPPVAPDKRLGSTRTPTESAESRRGLPRLWQRGCDSEGFPGGLVPLSSKPNSALFQGMCSAVASDAWQPSGTAAPAVR